MNIFEDGKMEKEKKRIMNYEKFTPPTVDISY